LLEQLPNKILTMPFECVIERTGDTLALDVLGTKVLNQVLGNECPP